MDHDDDEFYVSCLDNFGGVPYGDDDGMSHLGFNGVANQEDEVHANLLPFGENGMESIKLCMVKPP